MYVQYTLGEWYIPNTNSSLIVIRENWQVRKSNLYSLYSNGNCVMLSGKMRLL